MFEISLGSKFLQQYKNFPTSDQDKIDSFMEHYGDHGFIGLSGKNVDSSNVNSDDPEFVKKVKYALEHNLWHYHIGIPDYTLSNCGTYSTSEYVIHYQRISDYEIRVVDFSPHPPFILPSQSYIK